MSLVVFNSTCVSAIYNFTSSQEYDFEITNAAGNLIWRWSDGQAFMPVLHTVRSHAVP